MEGIPFVVQQLESLLDANEEIKNALEESIKTSEVKDVKTLDQFYEFASSLLTKVPTQRETDQATAEFFLLLNRSPNNFLREDPAFNRWVTDYTNEWGNFLDTTESAKSLDSFITNAKYNITDYDKGPSGWLTFNQFFARKLKPGKRPIAELCNDQVIVSTTDSVYQGYWPIDENSNITAKGTNYSIAELLNGSKYADKFTNGMFTHSYLSINDYHRFHTPVAGVIKEVRHIPGQLMLDVIKSEDGTLGAEDGVGYQLTQTRGMIIIESAVGYVAVLAVGMGHVSSVNITVEEGTRLVKGEEFGYFSFGGSDMILLFEPNRVELTAEEGKHYKMGEAIGRAI